MQALLVGTSPGQQEWGLRTREEGKLSRQLPHHTGHPQGAHVEPVHLRTDQWGGSKQSDCGSFCSIF